MVIESIDGAIKSSNRITLFIPSIECAIKCQSMIDWWLAWCVMWKVRVGINNFGTSYCYHLTVVLLDATFSKKHTKKRTISLKVHSNMKVMKVMKGWRWFNQSMAQSNHQIETRCLYHRLNVPSNQKSNHAADAIGETFTASNSHFAKPPHHQPPMPNTPNVCCILGPPRRGSAS